MPVIKALVDGAWVEVGGGGGAEEVEVGASEPTASTIELWVDTDDPGQSFPNMPRGYVGHVRLTGGDQNFTTAGAWANVAGMAVTWTADPSRRYRTTVVLSARKSAAAGQVFSGIRDAGDVFLDSVSWSIAGTSDFFQLEQVFVESGLSGSQTRKVAVHPAAGGVTVHGSGTAGSLILVEDIGAAGQSGGGVWTDPLPKGIVGRTVATASAFTVASVTAAPITVTAGQAPSMTLALNPARLYRITFNALYQMTTTTDRGYFEFWIGGAFYRYATIFSVGIANMNYYEPAVLIFQPASGALTTYEIRARNSVGTVTMSLASTAVNAPIEFMIEDIGVAV